MNRGRKDQKNHFKIKNIYTQHHTETTGVVRTKYPSDSQENLIHIEMSNRKCQGQIPYKDAMCLQ